MVRRLAVVLVYFLLLPGVARADLPTLPDDAATIHAYVAAELAAAEATALHKYYCAPTGSDTTGTGSITAPWQSPAPHVKLLHGGSVLYLRAGTYTPTVSGSYFCGFAQTDGTADRRIVLRNYPGEHAVLDATPAGGIAAASAVWHTTDLVGWTIIAGLEIRGTNQYGVGIPGHDARVLDCNFYGCQNDCVKTLLPPTIYMPTSPGGTNIIITGCYADGTNRAQLVDSFGDHVIIAGCTMEKPVPIVGGQPTAFLIKGGSIDNRIVGCHVTLGTAGVKVGGWAVPAISIGGWSTGSLKRRPDWEAKDCAAVGNVVTAYSYAALGFREAVDCQAIGNVLYSDANAEAVIDVYGNLHPPKGALSPSDPDYGLRHDCSGVTLQDNVVTGGGQAVTAVAEPVWLRVVEGNSTGFYADGDSATGGDLVLWEVPSVASRPQTMAAEKTWAQFQDLGFETGAPAPPPTDAVAITVGPTASPNPVASGGNVTLGVTATDTLGHVLSYAWTAAGGSFNDATKRAPVWTAPANVSGAPVSHALSLTVTCSGAHTATGSVAVVVSPTVADAVTVTAGPTASPATVASAGQVHLSITAADSLGHNLSYLWTAAAGAFDNATSATPVWTAPANTGQVPVGYTLAVIVTCSQGQAVSRSGQVTVAPAGGHDIACLGITVTPTWAGHPTTIAVAVADHGAFAETFQVRCSAGAYGVGIHNLALAAGASTTTTFNWKPSAPGQYPVVASIGPVVGEINLADNSARATVAVVTRPH